MKSASCWFATSLFVILMFGTSVVRAGIDGEANTDGVNPADELYNIAETKRLQQVGQQLQLNRFMTWNSYYGPSSLWGPPLGGPPVRQPIGYESKQVTPNRWIYRPVYGDERAPAEVIAAPAADAVANPIAPPPVDRKLPAPSDARPGDFRPLPASPQRPMPSGPREF
jgi:hypothetical protein